MPTRRALLTLVAAAASACTVPAARAVGNLVDLQVVDRGRGETLPTYRHRGASWIAGRPGERYALRLSNRSGGRVLVVVSVDGVNVVSGETAAVGQTGYVLGPWQAAEITGWRKSVSEAAAFYFTALPDSYAARTDRPDNVGVIGAAVFRERVAEVAEPAVPRSSAAPSAELESRRERSADRAAAAKEDKLGTGHGEREYAPVGQTTFERASAQPADVVQLRYDSLANLVAAGVVVRPRPWPRRPDAFPGFVPDPG